MKDGEKKDIWILLRNRFPCNEYALLAEVRDRAGFGAGRSADGIAMNLWPSRGLEIHGIEIKSSRGDWLRELKNPEKAEAIYQFCDRWWIVADGKDIVKEGEVPKTWGLYEARGNKLYEVVPAPKLNPTPLDRDFVAAMLKRATNGMIPAESIAAELQAARVEARKSEADFQKRNMGEYENLQEAVRAFEGKSGIHISGYMDTKKIGATVQLVLNGGIASLKGDLTRIKREVGDISKRIDDVLKEMAE